MPIQLHKESWPEEICIGYNIELADYVCKIHFNSEQCCCLFTIQKVKPVGRDANNNVYWYFDGKFKGCIKIWADVSTLFNINFAKSLLLLIVIIIIIIIIIISNVVEVIMEYFFPEGQVQTVTLVHRGVSLSLFYVMEHLAEYAQFGAILSSEFCGVWCC